MISRPRNDKRSSAMTNERNDKRFINQRVNGPAHQQSSA
jgi:hypothetical protein